jgi:hypothetical protein
MHNKGGKETQNHLMRFVELIIFHLSWKEVKWQGDAWAENEGENVQFSWRGEFF